MLENSKQEPVWVPMLSKSEGRDFPSGPVVKSPPSNAGDMGSIPGRGTKIPHAVQCGQKLKT